MCCKLLVVDEGKKSVVGKGKKSVLTSCKQTAGRVQCSEAAAE